MLQQSVAHLYLERLLIRKRAFVCQHLPRVHGVARPTSATGPSGQAALAWQCNAARASCCCDSGFEAAVAAHDGDGVGNVLGLAGSSDDAGDHDELRHVV